MDEFMVSPRRLPEPGQKFQHPDSPGLIMKVLPDGTWTQAPKGPGDENLPYMDPEDMLYAEQEAQGPSQPQVARQGPPRAPMKPQNPVSAAVSAIDPHQFAADLKANMPHDPKKKFLDSVKSRARGNMAQDMRKALAPVPQPVPPLPTPQTGGAPATPDPALEDMEAALGAMEAPVEVAGSRPIPGDPGDGDGPSLPPPTALAQAPGAEDGLEGLDGDELQRLLAGA